MGKRTAGFVCASIIALSTCIGLTGCAAMGGGGGVEGTYTGSIKYRENRFIRNQEAAERQEAYAAQFITSLELRGDNTFDLVLDVPMDGVWEKHEYGIKMTPRVDPDIKSGYWRNGDELIFKVEDGGKRLESMGSSGSYYEFIKD